MYQIALCEDEKIFYDEQERICRRIFEKLNIEYQLSLFDNSAKFIAAFSLEGKRFDLILLDIVMDGANGMELARMIRQADKDVTIIFITSNIGYALEGYNVQALNYLMKPVDEQVLEKLIETDYNNRFKNNYFVFEDGAQKVRVFINDIMCLETMGRKVAVTLDSRIVYYSGKLSQLLELLPKDRFLRCHQAYILNLQNIREFDGQNAIAINNKIVPVSRSYKKDVQKAFLKVNAF